MENNPAFLQVKDKKNLVASRLYQEGFSTGLLKKLAQELQVSLRTIRRWAKAVNGNNVESDNKEFVVSEIKKFIEDNYEHVKINICKITFNISIIWSSSDIDHLKSFIF